MLTHANISCNVQQFAAWFPDLKKGEESILAVFPFFHSAGFTAIQNFTVCGWQLRRSSCPAPSPESVLEMLKTYRPGFLPGVPTIFVGLLNTGGVPEDGSLLHQGVLRRGGAARAGDGQAAQRFDRQGNPTTSTASPETPPLPPAPPGRGKIEAGDRRRAAAQYGSEDRRSGNGKRGAADGKSGRDLHQGAAAHDGLLQETRGDRKRSRDGWLYRGTSASWTRTGI